MSIKSFFSLYFAKLIVKRNDLWKFNAVDAQRKVLNNLIKMGEETKFGIDHKFSQIKNYNTWKKHVPIRDYENFKDYIDEIISGEENVLWPGKPLYFSKTSGTTSGEKYIPISKESMPYHIQCARDAILTYIYETKNTSIVKGKMIFLQGSPKLKNVGGILTGRLSGIVAHHIPYYLKKNRLPSFSVNCIDDWEKKIDAIVKETVGEKMSLISGIPPWVQMYFEKIKKKTGKNISEVFPFFKLFIYGGVNFDPYKKTFRSLIGKNIDQIELFPASEGFIAYQDKLNEEGMLLCVNHGIFYEFIPLEKFMKGDRKRIMLEDVVLGVNYVVILNTNAGLWGYNIGDTVKFVNLNPYRIIVAGRINHYTSAFGEHVIAEEVEKAMEKTLADSNEDIGINEFHVAPQVNPKKGLPFHEWYIEFNSSRVNIKEFGSKLDANLQMLNVYYKDLVEGKVLSPLKIIVVKKGGFRNYLSLVGKLGGQNKPPRLANDRSVAEKLISFELKNE